MPQPHFGTYTLDTLLERNETIQEFGEERMLAAVRNSLTAHNQTVNEFMAPMVEFTRDRQRPYGERVGKTRVLGQRVDEFGAVDAMRPRVPEVEIGNIGFPLDRWQFAWQFDIDWVETKSPRDTALRLLGIQQGDLDRIEYEVKNALFNPVSNLTYRDQLIDQLNIPIRRLANGDGQMLPLGPNGQVFNPNTHLHYVGRAGGSLAATDIDALILNVLQHGLTGPLRIYINVAEEAMIKAFPNFYEFEAVEVVVREQVRGTVEMRNRGPLIETVNPTNPENMTIGRWNAKYDISTKPWVPAGYIMVMDTGKKPLAWRSRQDPTTAFGAQGRSALRVVGQHERFPLRAEWMAREFGIGVADRLSTAILYTGGTSYVMPSITVPTM